LKNDVPYLKSIGDFASLDVAGFVQDAPLRAAFADRKLDYDKALRVFGNPSPFGGEVWLDGSNTTQPVADPAGLLKAVRDATSRGAHIRAAYVPDSELGTRWFADKSVWVRDGSNYLPFDTSAGAQRYIAAHAGSVTVDYQQALAGTA
jgi:NitT/TauT family transport system substrate-binding protein